MNGMIISFEGMEGSGKSTQLGLLASRLRENHFEVTAAREPGGTRIGENIREITHSRENVDLTAACEAYLMAASRAQMVREIIRPSLTSGKIVLLDRFIYSSFAYQGFGRELGEEVIEKLNYLALDGVNLDLTFFLDVTPKIGHDRRNGTKKIDRLDLQQADFYERVYKGYKFIAQKNSIRIITIDGTKPIGEVAENIWKKVVEKLAL